MHLTALAMQGDSVNVVTNTAATELCKAAAWMSTLAVQPHSIGHTYFSFACRLCNI